MCLVARAAPWHPQPIGHPDVALAVNSKPAAAPAGFELLGLARIGGGKSRYMITKAVGDPDAIRLIDPEMERPQQRLARLYLPALANDLRIFRIEGHTHRDDTFRHL